MREIERDNLISFDMIESQVKKNGPSTAVNGAKTVVNDDPNGIRQKTTVYEQKTEQYDDVYG